jgi:hypothetical protein
MKVRSEEVSSLIIWGGFHFEKKPIHNKLFIFQMSIFFQKSQFICIFLMKNLGIQK